jgi:hypothetical protein
MERTGNVNEGEKGVRASLYIQYLPTYLGPVCPSIGTTNFWRGSFAGRRGRGGNPTHRAAAYARGAPANQQRQVCNCESA